MYDWVFPVHILFFFMELLLQQLTQKRHFSGYELIVNNKINTHSHGIIQCALKRGIKTATVSTLF